jgi:hypothetical protein
LWNAGPISDTRYAYEVIVNGPLRSIIKIRTMNWNSGSGSYELEQYYTAYAHQSYSTCRVQYTRFDHLATGVLMGCGIRQKPGEKWVLTDNNMVITAGPELIKDPEKIDQREDYQVDFVGSAIVVRDRYAPIYQYVGAREGNHALKITAPGNNGFEYMIFSAWSEGAVLNNFDDFAAYVEQSKTEYNHPVKSLVQPIEKKEVEADL